MKPIHSILVPTDFSDCSGPAVIFAGDLAKKTDAEIHLVHIVQEGEDQPGFTASGEWSTVAVPFDSNVTHMLGVLKQVKVRMNNLKKYTGLTGPGVHDAIEVGPVASSILKAAEKYKTDLIIMGTHGASGVKELLIGSNAEHVAHKAKIPVITTRCTVKHLPEKILFATDFAEEADRAFAYIREVAKMLNAELHLVKILLPDDDISLSRSRRMIHQFQERNQAQEIPAGLFKSDSKERGILEYANQHKTDLIAIGTHGRKGLGQFFNPGVSTDLVNHSFSPVMTINLKG